VCMEEGKNTRVTRSNCCSCEPQAAAHVVGRRCCSNALWASPYVMQRQSGGMTDMADPKNVCNACDIDNLAQCVMCMPAALTASATHNTPHPTHSMHCMLCSDRWNGTSFGSCLQL
jgi:hypothetical protein